MASRESSSALVALSGISICVLIASSTMAQESPPVAKKTSQETKVQQPAFAKVEEDPKLPRVLLIGDSISMGYTIPVRKLLSGKANVLRPETNCGPSSRGVQFLEAWLGKDKWDVIHFNFGLHDIVYFSEDGSKRVAPTEPGARHQVTAEDYEKNLQTIVKKLKETGAELVWCSTTPVPEGAAGRVADESVAYNALAAKVMQDNQITINDLHAFALPKLADVQQPKNVHFTATGSDVLAKQVASVIEAALAKRAERK